MKTYLLAIGLVGVSCSAAFSQSPAENDLSERLSKKGPDSIRALEAILEKPGEYSTLLLFHAALVAFADKRLEDSGFLFYAGQLRAGFDRACFPPKGTGGSSPFLAYAVVRSMFGSAINPAVTAEPKTFERSLARLEDWTPKAPKDYHPGYEFTERRSEEDVHEAVKAARTEFMAGMSGLAVLLNDMEYFAGFQVVQAHNLGSGDERPTKGAFEEAMATMRRIEDEKGIEGFSEMAEDSPTAELAEALKESRIVLCMGRMARKRPREHRRGLQRTSIRRRCPCSSTGILRRR
ncbi:MAG: hypothetical protein HQ582_17670 [Planctomycetes bacterium]|nr:hypothetical protein [Planctomycetota bacterium]